MFVVCIMYTIICHNILIDKLIDKLSIRREFSECM